jgi:hypothetical protein
LSQGEANAGRLYMSGKAVTEFSGSVGSHFTVIAKGYLLSQMISVAEMATTHCSELFVAIANGHLFTT